MTLLEDLDMLAEFFEGLIVDGSDTVKVTIKADAAGLPARLRAHVARIREEYAECASAARDPDGYYARMDLRLYERINGGPIATPGEPPKG